MSAEIMSLIHKRELPVLEDPNNFGEQLAFRSWSLLRFAAIPPDKRAKESGKTLRSNWFKLLFLIRRTKRQAPNEWIKFVNTFMLLQIEWEEEQAIEKKYLPTTS